MPVYLCSMLSVVHFSTSTCRNWICGCLHSLYAWGPQKTFGANVTAQTERSKCFCWYKYLSYFHRWEPERELDFLLTPLRSWSPPRVELAVSPSCGCTQAQLLTRVLRLRHLSPTTALLPLCVCVHCTHIDKTKCRNCYRVGSCHYSCMPRIYKWKELRWGWWNRKAPPFLKGGC